MFRIIFLLQMILLFSLNSNAYLLNSNAYNESEVLNYNENDINYEMYGNDDADGDDFIVQRLINKNSERILETLYARSSIGKSHRFYFTAGERKDGDQYIVQVGKMVGWKTDQNTIIDLKYPDGDNKEGKLLTYILVTVFQASEQNRIHLAEGGPNQKFATIHIEANSTKYVQYNATYYGFN